MIETDITPIKLTNRHGAVYLYPGVDPIVRIVSVPEGDGCQVITRGGGHEFVRETPIRVEEILNSWRTDHENLEASRA